MWIQIQKVNTNTNTEEKDDTQSQEIFPGETRFNLVQSCLLRGALAEGSGQGGHSRRGRLTPDRCKITNCPKIGMSDQHGNMKPLHWGSYSRYQIETNIYPSLHLEPLSCERGDSWLASSVSTYFLKATNALDAKCYRCRPSYMWSLYLATILATLY